MKEGYIIRDQEKAHFITVTVVDWIDVFTRKEYRDVVLILLTIVSITSICCFMDT
jgi:hypothetical protein